MVSSSMEFAKIFKQAATIVCPKLFPLSKEIGSLVSQSDLHFLGRNNFIVNNSY
jgi:hypothetical protein